MTDFNDLPNSTTQFKALLDQLEASYRDTVAESAIRMEKTILDNGGSAELASAFAMEWTRRLMDLTNLGEVSGD